MAKVERITFDDDSEDWWEIRGFLPVALEREFVQHTMDSQATLTQEYIDDPDPSIIIDLAKRMDVLVVQSTIGWSYGPVDMDTFYNEIPGYHYAEVAQKIGDLYSPLIVKCIERGLENYTSLLNQVEQSQ